MQSKRCPNRIHNNPGTLLEQSRRAVGIGVDVDEHEALPSLSLSLAGKKSAPATDFHSSHEAYPPHSPSSQCSQNPGRRRISSRYPLRGCCWWLEKKRIGSYL